MLKRIHVDHATALDLVQLEVCWCAFDSWFLLQLVSIKVPQPFLLTIVVRSLFFHTTCCTDDR